MELCVDLNIRYDNPDFESLVMKFNLMEKVAGNDVRGMLCLLVVVGKTNLVRFG